VLGRRTLGRGQPQGRRPGAVLGRALEGRELGAQLVHGRRLTGNGRLGGADPLGRGLGLGVRRFLQDRHQPPQALRLGLALGPGRIRLAADGLQGGDLGPELALPGRDGGQAGAGRGELLRQGAPVVLGLPETARQVGDLRFQARLGGAAGTHLALKLVAPPAQVLELAGKRRGLAA
jgi:hypothetical protein